MKICITLLMGIYLSSSAMGQRIGINNSTPRATLDVYGVAGTGRTAAAFGTEGAGITLQSDWPTLGFNQFRDNVAGNGKFMANGYAAIIHMDPGTGNIGIDMLGIGIGNLQTGPGIRAITIMNNGNVGIRNTASNATLAVFRGSGVDGTAVLAGAENWSHFNYSSAEDTYIRTGRLDGDIYLSQVPNGNVYFGSGATKLTTGVTPTATLTFQMTGYQFCLINDYNHRWSQRIYHISLAPAGSYMQWVYNGAEKGTFDFQNGVYSMVSDKKLKTDVQPLIPQLENLVKLRPVSYVMINDNPLQKRSLGFIAQEVKEVYPGLVRVMDNNARKGVHIKDLHTLNYTALHVISIKAIQEQYTQIRDLERENEELMNELRQIAEKLDIKIKATQ